MDISLWKERLSQLPLGDIHIYQQVGSTNEVARGLIQSGAKPFTLVLSDSQTAGNRLRNKGVSKLRFDDQFRIFRFKEDITWHYRINLWEN